MKLKSFGKIAVVLALGASLVACGGNKKENATANAGGSAEGKDLGTINVITREQGSGTRSAFTELTGVLVKEGDKEVDKTYEEAAVQSSTDAVLTTVQNDAGSIGYISLGSLNDDVKALKVEGVEATPENMETWKKNKAEEEKLEKENRAKANEIKKKISEITLTIKAKAGEGGRLFGAITSADIAKKLKQEHKIDVDNKKIVLEENIKEAGMKNIDIKLYPDVVATLKVNVRPES